MKKQFILALSMGVAFSACAQDKTAEKYAKLITPEDARKHLSILASDAFEGRETGKPGADKAAHYIADDFKKIGLEPGAKGSYFYDVPLQQINFSVDAFSVNGNAYTMWKDFYSTGTYPDNKIAASSVIFVGYGTADEIAGLDLAGKVILMINEDKPVEGKTTNTSYRMSNERQAILKNLQSLKPAIILEANPGVEGLMKQFGGRGMGARLSIKKPMAPNANAPVFNIGTTIADALVKSTGKSFDDLKKASATARQSQTINTNFSVGYSTTSTDVKAVDVLGFIPGTDLKDEILVFSAHYDHIGLVNDPNAKDKVNNGADDDGSGTTGILEIARAFMQAKKDGHGPRRSILFLGNVGEEKGLLGSEAYTDNPVYPLDKTITDLNIDMIGRVGYDYIGKPDSANYVYVIGSAMLSSDLRKISENANNTYTHLNLDYKYDDPADPNRFYYRSDHYNFAKHGVPIAFYFNGVHDDYHKPGDEVSKINFDLLAKRAQLVFYTGWDLANRDKRPVVDGKQ